MAKKYGMIFDENRCIGCQACNIACRSENDVPEGTFRLQVKVNGPYGDGNKLSFNFDRQSCMHCDNAPCVKVCPTNSLAINEDGIVANDKDKCIGCGYCLYACPYGIPQFPRGITKGIMDKCTFCSESRLKRGEEPACVTVCPTDSLIFGDINDTSSKVYALLHSQTITRKKEELGTNPKQFKIPNRKDYK